MQIVLVNKVNPVFIPSLKGWYFGTVEDPTLGGD